MRLCHSRMLFVRAYPRETQEMVLDAHDRGFAFFKGACTRGIYDNMKTAVDTILVGRERAYNRRFQQMCSHYLVDPVACTPASGWEKGQVENQVGLVRERFFTPRLRFKNYDEPTFPICPAHPSISSERYPRFSAAINTRCPVIALFVMRPAMCSPFRREFRPPYLHLDSVPLPTVCAASDGGAAQHRTGGGDGRSAAIAARICPNNPRETMTSAI